MDATELSYPVIGFRGPYSTIWRDATALTTEYLSAVKSGELQRHVVVDREGTVYRISKAVPQNVAMWRYLIDPLYGQRVRVRVELEPTGERWHADRLRKAVQRELRAWRGSQTREDYQELLAGIGSASTVPELMDFLARMRVRSAPGDG